MRVRGYPGRRTATANSQEKGGGRFSVSTFAFLVNFLQTNRSLNGTLRDSAQETSTISETLESRLRAIEGELDRLKAGNQKLVTRLDQVDRKRGASTSHETSSPQGNETNAMELLGRRAFDVCDLLLYFFFCLDFLTDVVSLSGSGITTLLLLLTSHRSKTPTTKFVLGLPSLPIQSCELISL